MDCRGVRIKHCLKRVPWEFCQSHCPDEEEESSLHCHRSSFYPVFSHPSISHQAAYNMCFHCTCMFWVCAFVPSALCVRTVWVVWVLNSPSFPLFPSVLVCVSASYFHHQLAAPSCPRLSPRLESGLAGHSAARACFSVSSFQEICNSDERTEERYGNTWYLACCWWVCGSAAPNMRRFGTKGGREF